MGQIGKWIATAALSAVALTACVETGGSRQPVSLLGEVYATGPEAVEVEVGVSSCNGDPTFELTETDQTITIAAESWIPSGSDRNDCLDVIVVQLDQPLGDRSIFDDVAGQTVGLVTDADQ